MSRKDMLIVFGIALLALWAYNNVAFLRTIVGPRATA